MSQYSGNDQLRVTSALVGVAIGTLAVYFSDPVNGRRRRALVQDKMHSAVSRSNDIIDVTLRDLRNRSQGLRAKAARMLTLQGSGKQERGTGKQSQRDSSRFKGSFKPATRALAIMGGGALCLYGISRRTPASTLLAKTGLGLMLRGIINMPVRRMVGMDPGKGVVDINKTIFIQAPVDNVFDLWSKYENFPYFMSNVQEVRDLGNGRSHWVVKGPGGIQAEWDAVMTEFKRPEALSWKSEPNSMVHNQGMIHFQPEGSGTRVSIHISYSPPAGVLGHAVASLFGHDPKRQMDEDLMRMKSLFETGKVPHDAARQLDQRASSTLH